MLEKSSTSRSK